MAGSGDKGQLSIDMSPTQPHTTTKNARSCESCHTSEKALGYGIGGGKLTRPWNEKHIVDLETANDKTILSRNAKVQMEAIEGLEHDWSRIVTEDGVQVATVGHHFKLSRPLNNAERAKMSRQGACQACHQTLPEKDLAVSLLHHVAAVTGQIPKSGTEHDALLSKILFTSAWSQVGLVALLLGGVGFGAWRWRRKRRSL